ncbi:MAG: SusC/RagA family TonB-linked outer membrane protein [Gemmatimonadaceae bacterium]
MHLGIRRWLVRAALLGAAWATGHPAALAAQGEGGTGTVRGRVTDAANGAGLAGVQVEVVGTRLGAVTRDDGAYAIAAVPGGAQTIALRRIGYAAARQAVAVPAGGSVTVDVALRAAAVSLEQVVVTGTAAPTSRRALGTTLATVDSATLTGGARPQTIDAALQGKIAGAQITQNSGNPGGGGISVRLRGTSSIISGSEPLYIIDGVIVDNSSDQLIDLGSRGALQNRLADLNPNDIERIEVVKGAAAAALYGSRANNGVVQIFTKRGQAGRTRVSLESRYSSNEVTGRIPVNAYPTADSVGSTTPVTRYDYQDEVYRTGGVAENTLSLSGGDERTTFFVSGSMLDERGVIRNSGSDRRSARLNLTQQLFAPLRLTATGSFASSHVDFQPEGEQSAGVLGGIWLTPTTYDFHPKNGVYPQSFVGADYANPLDVIANWKAPQDVNRFTGSVRADYAPLSKLAVAYTLGYDGYDQRLNQYTPRGSLANQDAAGLAQSIIRQSRIVNSDAVATLTSRPADAITLQTSAGLNYTDQRLVTTYAASRDLVPTVTLPGGGAVPLLPGQTETPLKTFGLYAQEVVSVRDRLFLTGALRSDEASTFGAGERRQYYPKASLSYVLSDEPFFKDSRLGGAFSTLRLRAALGYAGNQPSITNAFAQFSNYARAVADGRVGVVNALTLGNPSVKPERQREFEGGVDLGLLRNRVSLEATYYNKYLSDLLLQVPVSPTTGYMTQFANAGEMTNKGVELLLRTVNLDRPSLNWTTTTTYAANRNHVVSVTAPFTDAGGYANRVAAGEPVGFFYGSYYQRDASGKIKTGPTGLPLRAAQDPTLPPNRKIGDPNPAWSGSLLNELRVGRGLTARVLLDGTFGQDVFNFTRRATEIFGTSKAKERELRGELPAGYLNARSRVFEEYIENGSFVKLREVSLTYELGSLVRSTRLSGAAVTLAGRNLHTWTKYGGLDPEVNVFGQSTLSRGNDFGTIPVPRTFTAGIRLTY